MQLWNDRKLYFEFLCVVSATRGRQPGRGRGRVRGQRGRLAGGRGTQKQPATSTDKARSRSAVDSTWKQQSCPVADVPFTGKPGIQVQVPTSALKFVQLFCLTDDDLQYITAETNRYAHQYFTENPKDSLPTNSRLRDWKDTSKEELKLFFALVISMGLVVKPKLEDYWSMDEVLETPFFGTVMARNRFELILKFLHAADNTNCKKRGEDGYDPLFRIRELHDRYLTRSQSVYVPERDLSLDEATMLWKGHVSYRVYNPKKPIKFGVKIYEVCESVSGYIVNWQMYTGKTEASQEHGHCYRIVFDLLSDRLRELGYRLYVDRYYSSPKLFEDLYSHKIPATGTVMPNRKGMPQQIKSTKLKRGDVVVYQKGNLQCMKWHDKRDIYVLTNTHACTMQDTGRVDRQRSPIVKPECILRYNEMMGGVDRNDQLSKYYSFARKVMKVWKKQFFHLMNAMLLQGYIMYLKYTDDSPKLSQFDFRLAVVRELITSSHSTELLPQHRQRRSSSKVESLTRMTARHFPAYIPRTESKEHPQRKCVVCQARKIRKESIYWCRDCKVTLCVAPCFGDYHLKIHFSVSTTTTEDSDSN